MFAMPRLSSGQKGTWLKSKHLPRALKVTAATIALFYIIAGGKIAGDYAGSPQLVSTNLGTQVTKTIWMGVAWPVVLHNTMTTHPLQRLGPIPRLGS